LIDGDVKITQSNAIISHIARKNGLSGKTEAEQAMVDMLLNVAMDFRNGFVRLCYSDNSNFTSQRQKYEDNIKIKLKEFSSFLGQKPWFAGNEITCADFVFYELLDQHKLFNPSLLDGLDNIKGFLSRFEELPAIKAYMNSPEFLRFPVNNTSASWFGSS
jgi:glutathione S-transferase